MIEREIEIVLREKLQYMPAIYLNGPRQSGKSTLVKKMLPNYKYVSLENKSVLDSALNDSIGFLSNLGKNVIINEAQKCPDLFSYLQNIIDDSNEPGMFVLSSSQNFLMMQSITQSLAGRVSVNSLLPLSVSELNSEFNTMEINDFILNCLISRLKIYYKHIQFMATYLKIW